MRQAIKVQGEFTSDSFIAAAMMTLYADVSVLLTVHDYPQNLYGLGERDDTTEAPGIIRSSRMARDSPDA